MVSSPIPVFQSFTFYSFLFINVADPVHQWQGKCLEMFRKVFQTYQDAFSGISKENWLLSFVILINRSGTMAIVFMSIYVTQILGYSLSQAGLIITVFGLGAVAGSLLGGYLTDTIGFRSVQILSSLFTGLLFIVFGFVHQFSWLCVTAALLGCIAETMRPANFAAIAGYSNPQNLTKSYSLNRFAVNIGFGLGSIIGGILASIDYHLLFWVEGLTNILVAFLIFSLLPAQKMAPVTTQPSGKYQSGSPWKDTLFLKFLLMILVYITCFILVFKLAPVYWKETTQMKESTIGMVLGLNGLLIALFEMVLIQKLQQKGKDITYIFWGILFTAAGFIFLLVPVYSIIVSAFIVIVFITLGEMFSLPFVNTFIILRANDLNKGKYAAAYSLVWSIANVIGPAGGALLAEWSNYSVLWIAVIVLCLLSGWGIRKMQLH